uniref:AlNc14C334G10724 protein n=1 Tax=Albugo laibachii Nc14 TaxID=890382 RepID=F0WWW3_9STRA|nr:AlNc14C334G10724 [Albugo laibachii Nc14]|eukprot:CCA25948.1 AlNc14C334G10724 [Albugo laibachii Nc14]
MYLEHMIDSVFESGLSLLVYHSVSSQCSFDAKARQVDLACLQCEAQKQRNFSGLVKQEPFSNSNEGEPVRRFFYGKRNRFGRLQFLSQQKKSLDWRKHLSLMQ